MQSQIINKKWTSSLAAKRLYSTTVTCKYWLYRRSYCMQYSHKSNSNSSLKTVTQERQIDKMDLQHWNVFQVLAFNWINALTKSRHLPVQVTVISQLSLRCEHVSLNVTQLTSDACYSWLLWNFFTIGTRSRLFLKHWPSHCKKTKLSCHRKHTILHITKRRCYV